MKFQDYLKEAAGDTVGIMFGRFNPPHKGHRAAWEMASENDHWYVGTNQSTQGKKDPLPYDVKIKAMEALWPEVGSHIVPETNLFTLASKVFAEHGEGLNLVVYTDEDWLTKTLEKYNGEEAKHGYYNFASIQQKPTPRLSSATDVRNAVLADDRDAFERAAGVPADYKIDGVDYFDLVAEYLLPYHTKESKDDKYLQQGNIEESTMNLNELRKLSGLPLKEGAPVVFGDKIKPAHGMTNIERKLSDIGRLMMDMAKSEEDDAASNAMAQLGDRLATGGITTQQDLVDFVKSSTADPALLSDRVTNVFASYNAGERADLSKIDDRRKGTAKPDDDDDADMDDDAAMSAIDDMDPLEDSVDLSDISAQYGIDEGAGTPVIVTVRSQGTEKYVVSAVTTDEAREKAERYGHEVVDAQYAQGDDEVWSFPELERKVQEADEGETCDCCGNEVVDGKCGCGPECPHCGGRPGMDEMDESIEETADNAMTAAMAELRKLAGL